MSGWISEIFLRSICTFKQSILQLNFLYAKNDDWTQNDQLETKVYCEQNVTLTLYFLKASVSWQVATNSCYSLLINKRYICTYYTN